ncbi:hypothetical protein CBR_g39615 [Chara braunii]|uniref:Uncharacterized protein n=1 Tax=Chara braunii TaxID=69332 RepID=A0A388K1A8_CHABU|nr:hypothetical protein CBR_g39615 [Chara braunii]|eukprot:GBG63830.1 hypothetical protein CBR_g39615 [Chara braunii]
MANFHVGREPAARQGGGGSSMAIPRRCYDPLLYNHLELHEQPLPPSDEELETEELTTLPLGSGSTQMWSQTLATGGSGCNEGGEFTSLLQQGLQDDDGQVDMRFGLSPGGATTATRTQHGKSATSDQGGRDACPAPAGVTTVPLRIGGGSLPMSNRTRTTQPDFRDNTVCRPPVCPRPTMDSIIRGVSNMRAHNDGGVGDVACLDDADDGGTEEMETGDDEDDVDIQPLGKTAGRVKGCGRGGGRGRSAGRVGRGDASEDSGKSATYWSMDEQLVLVRCKPQKREQDMHMAGNANKGVEVGRHSKTDGRHGDGKRSRRLFQDVGQSLSKLQEDTEISREERQGKFLKADERRTEGEQFQVPDGEGAVQRDPSEHAGQPHYFSSQRRRHW